jgi:hypothetical protein
MVEVCLAVGILPARVFDSMCSIGWVSEETFVKEEPSSGAVSMEKVAKDGSRPA